MIKTINMKNCASYDNEGISICDCNRVNYIYGHNGSGKSTISNYLQDPSLAQFCDCSIEWELGTESEVHVYNKTFRQKNLQSMPGVFTLGEATAEQIKHLEELKEAKEKRRNELLTLKKSIQVKKAEKKHLYESFEKDAWNTILKKNEDVFLDAFTGLRGKKALFAGKVLSEYKKKPTTKSSREELVEKAKTLFAKKPDLLSEITIPKVASLCEIETNEIWGKVIIGNNDVDMAALINALHNSDGVKAGMNYIGDDGVCPFCQKKTVDKIVIGQLNQFFSGEYERQNKIVEELRNQYRTITSALLEQISEWVNAAKAQAIEFDLSKLEVYRKTFELLIGKNIELFESKKAEPSRSVTVDLSSDISKKMQDVMETYNAKIKEHNKLVDDYGRNQTDTKVSFWTLLKKNEISTVKSYNNKNPITTSYALLWKEVKNSDSISSVSLQNAMRRILENFFGTLGNANFGDILKYFDSPEEQSICRSLFSWTNDGSHSIPDDLEFSEDNDSSEKFKKVFKDVFYNTHNQYHYDRMME